MKSCIMNVEQIPRRSRAVFPLRRIGFLFPIQSQERRSYTNKLELCLRLSSDSSRAVDEIDGIRFETPFPHVVLKLPDSVHTYAIDARRDAIYLQYAPELEEPMREAGLLNTPRVWQVTISPEILAQIHRLHEMLPDSAQPGMIEQIDLAAMSLFEYLIAQDPVRNPVQEEVAERIGQITTWFHLHFTEEIELDALLRKHGFSRRTFFRYWRRIHSIGPADYIRELRVRHAAELLIETGLPVNSIAMRVNLRNFCYFSRLFRRYYGVTPIQYRRSHRQEGKAAKTVAGMSDELFGRKI